MVLRDTNSHRLATIGCTKTLNQFWIVNKHFLWKSTVCVLIYKYFFLCFFFCHHLRLRFVKFAITFLFILLVLFSFALHLFFYILLFFDVAMCFVILLIFVSCLKLSCLIFLHNNNRNNLHHLNFFTYISLSLFFIVFLLHHKTIFWFGASQQTVLLYLLFHNSW